MEESLRKYSVHADKSILFFFLYMPFSNFVRREKKMIPLPIIFTRKYSRTDFSYPEILARRYIGCQDIYLCNCILLKKVSPLRQYRS